MCLPLVSCTPDVASALPDYDRRQINAMSSLLSVCPNRQSRRVLVDYDRLLSLGAGDDISISRPIRLAASARLAQI